MIDNEKTNTTAQSGGVPIPDLLADIELQKAEITRLNLEIENKKSELATLSDKVNESIAEIGLHKSELARLDEDIKALESLKPSPEKDILDDVEDVKIVYKSFSLDGKKYDRDELGAALNQGDKDAYEVIRKLVTLKSGAIELIKTKE